jgi:hypothetical protein
MKVRHGQSNVVGGTFLVLIIIAAYSLFLTYNQSQSTYTKAQDETRRLDMEMQQESLSFFYGYKWLNGFYNKSEQYLSILNSGSLSAHIISIGDVGDKIIYNETDFYMLPGTSFIISDKLEELSLNLTGKEIQFVTERGNVFQVSYIPRRDTPVQDYEVQIVYGGLQQVVGDFIFKYDTFAWANFSQIDTTPFYQPIAWNNNWEIPEGYDVFFRINVTHLGESNKQVSGFTVIHFVDDGQKQHPFFILFDINDEYNNENITSYLPARRIVVGPEEEITLYFGASDPYTLLIDNYFKKMKVGLYNGILTIYDYYEDYSQAFPFIGLIVYK